MKFLYIANIRIPTEKAHGAQIMKTCEALAKANVLEALIVSNRKSPITTDPLEYYGIKTPFPIEKAAVFDTVTWGRLGFWIESLCFVWSARLKARAYGNSLLYGRDELVMWLLTLFSKRSFVWESHTGAWNLAARSVARRAKVLVVISHGLKDWYVEKGISAEKIIVAPDGIDLVSFEGIEAPEIARARLGLPNIFTALYVGRLDGWKGAEAICEASRLLPEPVQVVLIGGEPNQVAHLQRNYPKARFLGFHPYAELPKNLSAADVLLLPTSAKDEIGARFTSPMKLFAYLAARKPIIASDVPSNREILRESDAIFMPPDDPEALANAIMSVFEMTSAERISMAESAHNRARVYTWDARARILEELL